MKNELLPKVFEDLFSLKNRNTEEMEIATHCFDIIDSFIVAINKEGKITLINRKGLEILEYSRKEIINKHLANHLVEERDREKTLQKLEFFMHKEEADQPFFHLKLVSRSGEIKWIKSKVSFVQNNDNQIKGLLISGDDITEHIKNEEIIRHNMDLHRILTNNLPGINLYLFDHNLRFIIAEGMEMKKCGMNPNDFLGKQITEIKDKELTGRWLPLFRTTLNGDEITTEYKYKQNDYLISLLPLKNEDGKIYSGIAITQNITKEKQVSDTLERAKREAEDSNRAKSMFIANISHEIRTPLNAIVGFTEQLLQTNLTKEQREHLKVIDKSSEHLLSLVNDMLILSKIEAGEVNFDHAPFKIARTVKYVHKLFISRALEKGIALKYEIDPQLDIILKGDAFRLRQILINMISNAIKFTHKGSIVLKGTVHEMKKNTVKIKFEIKDTGIGISREKLHIIFEQFKQADSKITMDYGGTGLGLTICKNLIELQKGTLSVESQEGSGTTFTFIIPYEKAEETEIISDNQDIIDYNELKDVRVLLVDDDSVNRLLGKTILNKFSCITDIANEGKEAIDKLDKNNYDIVLLDIHMPDINGLQVAEYLRNTLKDRKTKIVAVTAAVLKDDIQDYYRAGINDFLVKPFKESNLYHKMCDVLQVNKKETYRTKAEIILKEESKPQKYDLSELRKMAGNNKKFVKTMLTTFIQNSENSILSFKNLLKQENWKDIGETAHKILPSYRHLEVVDVEQKLLKLKKLTLIEPDYAKVPELVSETIESIIEVIKSLKTEIE